MTNTKSRILFIIGILLMISVVILGQVIQDEVEMLGMKGYMEAGPEVNKLIMLFFAFGFPLGIGLVIAASIVAGRGSKSTVRWFLTAAIAGVILTLIIHRIIGTAHSPAYFGTGGIAIMLLIIVFSWYWSVYRADLDDKYHKASDFQAMGYLCFALAAWNLCGVGSIPGMAMYPEKMLTLEPHFFAVAQMKAVMAFFVSGWAFTVIGVKQFISVSSK